MTRLSLDDIEALKLRNPVDAVAGQWVRLRRKGQGYVGPCPLCQVDAQSKSKSAFECTSDKWVCAKCPDGGDVIRLVARRNGLDEKRDFMKVVELLGGATKEAATPATAQRSGGQAYRAGSAMEPPADYGEDLRRAWFEGYRKAADQARQGEAYRERERARLFRDYWERATRWLGSPVEAYIYRARHASLPDNARLRYLADCPYYVDGPGGLPLEVHRGPCMLAAIFGRDPAAADDVVAAGGGYRFAGLHFTWLDLNQPKGKARIVHPHTGEPMPAKKARGSKQGGYIDLGGRAARAASQMIVAEGIENIARVHKALTAAGRDTLRFHYRCGIDLGNLAGKALGRARHPTLKTESGRARFVPDAVPDMASPAMPVPAAVGRIIWLCDGDSDPFMTRLAMERATARHDSPGRVQRLLWPGQGRDFDDWK